MNVFLNPGHALGGNPDPGCVREGLGLRECDLAMTYGSLAAKYLEQAGCNVRLIQSHNLAGESPGWPDVTESANSWPADLFVSIHVNAGGGRGPETYCYQIPSVAGTLATCVQRQLASTMMAIDRGCYDRGVKQRHDLCVLRATAMPAILVETGFIDSDDVAILTGHGDDIARAIARGVTDYWVQLE